MDNNNTEYLCSGWLGQHKKYQIIKNIYEYLLESQYLSNQYLKKKNYPIYFHISVSNVLNNWREIH